MNLREYRQKHKKCRLLTLFPGLRVPTGIGESFVQVPHWACGASELHHIIPRSIAPKKLRDDIRNLIHLHHESHRFVTEYKNPGTVMCLYAKWEMGELDVSFLSECASKDLIGYLSGSDFEDQCSRWDWIESMRQELIRGKYD